VSGSGYTLLIVESPTIGRQLQKLVPQHVLVIPTKGYLWMPSYQADKNTLRKAAIPEKLETRNLIREESKKSR
jgi:DNA topoisomerase IA